MREILHKKRQSLKNNRKIISICESSDKKEYKTSVKKHFVYVVEKVDSMRPDLKEPNIYITKHIDSKKKEERFLFRVKGVFYMSQDRAFFRVNFRHSLNICIKWKTKDFSPKKSATLT